MAKSELVNITILVAESHLGSLLKVVDDLVSKGFKLKESLNEIGVLIGSAPKVSLANLTGVQGVQTIEQDRSDYQTQN